MLFNSFQFLVFLPIVFGFYWLFSKSLKIQNVILLCSSYFFYSRWDYRFLFLLIFSTLLDYFTGLKIEKTIENKSKKIWLILSIGINLGFLFVFKYYNFFINSFNKLLIYFHFEVDIWILKIILPVGISFYTFHGISYLIDIYHQKIRAERNFVNYSLFVSYFPLLVAGPIERATHLLPQIKKERTFNYVRTIDGLKLILFGLFKKIVIGDLAAIMVNDIFNNYNLYNGSSLAIGAVLFAFQIYGDFSGYSDIAMGVSKLFGIELLKNFSLPYFSRDIAEFWRRWHISLSSWFRDYVYIPLGGSKSTTFKKIRNIFIIFILSGFWHGANWTFIIWGLLNAMYFLPLMLLKNNRNNITIVAYESNATFKDLINIITTFILTCFGWIFFRSINIKQAINYINQIFSYSIFEKPNFTTYNQFLSYFILLIFFLFLEWKGRKYNHTLEDFGINWKRKYRYLFYYMMIFLIIFLQGKEQKFIYFNF